MYIHTAPQAVQLTPKLKKAQPAKSSLGQWVQGVQLVSLVIASIIIATNFVSRSESVTHIQNVQSQAIAETGATRILAKIINSEHRSLLTKTYDPLAAENSEWTADQNNPVPSTLLAGNVNEGNYKLVAYRYNELKQQGTFVIEGNLDGVVSRIEVVGDITFSSESNLPKITRQSSTLVSLVEL